MSRKPPVGVWQDPRGKKTPIGRWKTKGGPYATSYYVANLPKDTTPMEVEECFQEFGTVVDVYVASRKDKPGSFFGFVRITGVRDRWELEKVYEGGDKPFLRALLRNQRQSTSAQEVIVPDDADYDVVQCNIGWDVDYAISGKLRRWFSNKQYGGDSSRGDWSMPEPITLRWKDKSYKVWFQEEDDGWCPGWCGEKNVPEES
ncbi:hypothetical protein L1987_13520 [Smallanthus sonchifolius]|uniref:Uncharacterized protein n=1 Tax=Smallanthus sonchifolius TaxID=185202 RepID=A0ACB9JIA3_9ASTR|nr:hypothetical protein L1987_13520 [Smallanthus sonchifolius]